MAKRAKKTPRRSKRKSTDWGVGQPLAFPQVKNLTALDRLAHQAVEESLRGPFKLKQEKRKKK
jgi:hypothetical protein